ncbi:Serpentine Receptor, class H [Caenorhabditis elegans]|uniref:Serpentine Receptor, class H n=1 Tax=Caenorhabditis elegans TaxID=6239 RepID=O16782_CAEEL|nr:Serpentine Receptor, class H [Caenorhabditis elegans]CCD72525.2 Serpentine Receptor, class H [Caenorhabditis elegans]|eukprot:NP_499894.3 Serpentine Receptor, class H [Caenorhabditis elegans]
MCSTKLHLLNFLMWSMAYDMIMTCVGQPYLFSTTMAGIPLGFLHMIGIGTGAQIYFGMTIAAFCAISTVQLFENRFFVLFAEKTWWRHVRYPFKVFNITFGVAFYLPTYYAMPDQYLPRQQLFMVHPELIQFDSPENPIFVMALDFPWIPVYSQRVFTIIIIIEMIVFGTLLQVNMNWAVRKMIVSNKTLQLQRDFVKSIKLQILIPLLFVVLPSAWLAIMGAYNISDQGSGNLARNIISLHGVSSTVLMIYLQKPYRQYFKQIFNFK